MPSKFVLQYLHLAPACFLLHVWWYVYAPFVVDYAEGSQIIILVFLSTLLPSKYIAKLVYFLGGFYFWHVIPIITALSPSDRAR
jgi:hypothetical protein